MNEEPARRLLRRAIQPDGSLREMEPSWIVWPDGDRITIDGTFTAEYLEALAWWMSNNKSPRHT